MVKNFLLLIFLELSFRLTTLKRMMYVCQVLLTPIRNVSTAVLYPRKTKIIRFMFYRSISDTVPSEPVLSFENLRGTLNFKSSL